jgi:hypothetical protein
MGLRFTQSARWGPALAGAALLALAVPPAQAQMGIQPAPGDCRPGVPASPYATLPSIPLSPPTGTGEAGAGQAQPPATAETGTAAPTAPTPDLSVTSGAGGGGSVALNTSNVGYIDSAIPFSNFRVRYDAAYGANRPDRAEFFYAKCGCFRTAAVPDPRAPGPRLGETNVDYQDIRAYLEVALGERFSVFAEVPFRFLNPAENANTAGVGDMNAGFKVALLYDPDRVLSFQLRTYIPTGDSFHGLGTDHVSLEPALLLFQKLGERAQLEAQLEDWIPIGGTDFAGNIINYGVGLSYFVVNNERFRVSPVIEFLGWTVLDGKEFAFPEGGTGTTLNSSGKTIVNGKFGVRIGFGPATQPGTISNSSLYVGYARALTGDVWYKDMLRVEYRLRF